MVYNNNFRLREAAKKIIFFNGPAIKTLGKASKNTIDSCGDVCKRRKGGGQPPVCNQLGFFLREKDAECSETKYIHVCLFAS